MTAEGPTRCAWCGDDPVYQRYHDEVWGVPAHEDSRLFEFLTLEGAQAGLSWITILRKQANYARCFHDWQIDRIAAMTDQELTALLSDPGIIRNRRKIWSVRRNAQVCLEIQQRHGSLDDFLWSYVDGHPVVNHGRYDRDFPTHSAVSDRLAADLKSLGMSFVGTTIVYSLMQAVGMVNDHIDGCFRKAECAGIES